MPDISMCTAETCSAAGNCYRSPKSGTRPDDMQSWSSFEPEKGPDCNGFWLVSEHTVTDIDEHVLRLETIDRPEAVEMSAAAILDDWRIATCGAVERRLVAACGIVSRSRKFADGEVVTTSPIASVDVAQRWIRTRNSLYLLGTPHQKMPFVVHVATRANWIEAWRAACEGTGQHTVPDWVWAAALEAGLETIDWSRRHRAANAVGEELARAGRPSVAGAWWTLATDASDKDAARYTHERLCVAVGSHQTPEASDVIDGWDMLANDQTDGGDLSDCIAAARRIGDLGKRNEHNPLSLLVRMAMAPSATSAARVFLSSVRIPAGLAEQFDMQQLLDPETRRTTARGMLDMYCGTAAAHDDLYLGLRLLGLTATDLIGCNHIRSRIETGLREAGIDPETDRVARAWRIMASDLAAPCNPNDPVASAWQIDTSSAIDAPRGTDALKELFVGDTAAETGRLGADALRESAVDVDAPTASEKSGVVVLVKVGGTTKTTSGREVGREFKAIEGRTLPFVMAGDLMRARVVLRDEFPHLHQKIDVLLSDFVEGEPIRLRPTLLVGLSGGGKSRLVRRLAECLEIGLHRYDAAGSSDNAFGGTARRWSSGEHCQPLEAIRRYQIANAWLLIDEIDKAAIGRHNGLLSNALMPFMDSETAKVFPDPFVQAEVNLSHVGFFLTANDDTLLPSPLRDRLRVIRLPSPTIEHMPALARGIVTDIAKERGGDARWWPMLEDGELAIAEELWPGGSVRRLRAVVERILAYREQKPRN